MDPSPVKPLSPKARKQIRQLVLQASKLTAPFWPLRAMVSQGPIHGQECLPFDQHIREGKHLLAGYRYLANEEYRQSYRDGRINPEDLTRAFQRIGPRQNQQDRIQLESREIVPLDVWWLHLLGGFEPLEPSRLEWELGDHGSTKHFHQHLSKEARKRIIDRTIEECELCREYPEKATLPISGRRL